MKRKRRFCDNVAEASVKDNDEVAPDEIEEAESRGRRSR